MAGIDMVHVPYRGGAPMITDLLAGQVQIGFDVDGHLAAACAHGRVACARGRRQPALRGAARGADLAEVLPGYEARTWAGLGAPKGTPAAVIARLDREIGAVLAERTIEARLADLGTVPMPLNAQEFAAFIAAESDKWAKWRIRRHKAPLIVKPRQNTS
jgi:tripartite-type tricarboxylate transporter receptor subunit TctC